MHLLFLLLASTVLFKWVDDKGAIHLSDRLADVPAKHRAAFAKLAEESAKKKPTPSVAPAPADQASDAYSKYLERRALERVTKQKSEKLRTRIGDSRKKISELEEERGNLAANPLLNVAQPIRVERMQTIDKEIGDHSRSIESTLEELKGMLIDSKQMDYPEEWVTGL